MTEREALKLALDYIVATNKSSEFWLIPASNLNKTVTAIKEALAQPEQEPVAWFRYETVYEYKNQLARCTKDCIGAFPVYTTPPQRKPLTDEEIILIVADCASSHQHTDIHFARAIEAKLKEKNR